MIEYRDPHTSLKLFDALVKTQFVGGESPLLCVLDMNKPISMTLLNKYKKTFPWQFQDNHESWTEERIGGPMGYWNRLAVHFGVHQVEKLLETSFASVLSAWDPTIDIDERNKPCFLSARFVKRRGRVDMHVTYRAREILSRMIGNWDELISLVKYVAKERRMKVGVLYDFSYSAWTSDENLAKWGGK